MYLLYVHNKELLTDPHTKMKSKKSLSNRFIAAFVGEHWFEKKL